MLTEYYFAVRYGDIIILLCYMIDVKVPFEGLKGEKTKGLKATLKFAKEHDMCMTEAQIQGANNM